MFFFYGLVFAGAVAVTLAGVWFFTRLAARLRLMDEPEGRKTHLRATPVVGGLAIVLGATVAILAAMASGYRASDMILVGRQHVGFLIGAVLLVVVGMLDDRKPIAARYKLLVQLAACVVAVALDQVMVGEVVLFVGGGPVTLGPLVGPFTILVMLTITNAINMIDGVDGLAAGITFVGFAIMAKALIASGFATAPYVVAAAGAVAGFLLLNFPLLPGRPAKVFLGDSGSLLCGFTLAYLAIDQSSLPNRVFRPSTALWFFFIPVADTIWLYMRRTWVARAPFAAGRDHIHHLLQEWLSPRLVTWALVAASGVMAVGAYFAERRGAPSIMLIGTWILAFVVYGALTQRPWRRAWEKGPVHAAQQERKALAAKAVPESD